MCNLWGQKISTEASTEVYRREEAGKGTGEGSEASLSSKPILEQSTRGQSAPELLEDADAHHLKSFNSLFLGTANGINVSRLSENKDPHAKEKRAYYLFQIADFFRTANLDRGSLKPKVFLYV